MHWQGSAFQKALLYCMQGSAFQKPQKHLEVTAKGHAHLSLVAAAAGPGALPRFGPTSFGQIIPSSSMPQSKYPHSEPATFWQAATATCALCCPCWRVPARGNRYYTQYPIILSGRDGQILQIEGTWPVTIDIPCMRECPPRTPSVARSH